MGYFAGEVGLEPTVFGLTGRRCIPLKLLTQLNSKEY